MARDKEVVGADHLTATLKIGLDVGGVVSAVGIEIQYRDPCEQALDQGSLLYRPRRAECAMHEFVSNNHRRENVGGPFVKSNVQLAGSIA